MRRAAPLAKVKAVRRAVRRHPPRVLLLWALGALAILACAFALSDPALLMFALDPELAAVLVLGSVALLRASPAVVVARGLATSARHAVRRRARRRSRPGS